jgi:anti-sigma-K factor RskA
VDLRVVRTHEEYKEMLAVHALGTLDGAEARELETHLAACAECLEEAGSWQDVASALAHVAPQVEPPKELRSRILSSVRNEEGARSSSRAGSQGERKLEGGGARSARTDSKVVPFERPARRTWSTAAKFGALAASLAFIALALSLLMLWNRYSAVRREVAQLTDQLGQAREEVARASENLARERETRELISAPEARIMALNGTEMATRARAKFVYDRTSGRAMLMADDLPPAPAGKAYQLWFIAEGKPPMPGHVFNTNAEGHAEMREQLPEEARGANTFAVTLEPSNGVQAPTGPMYLKGAASS